MGKVVAGLCCCIVGLQVLVGVPLAVCYAFLGSLQGSAVFPVAVAMDTGDRFQATLPPPPNLIPATTPVADHPMLAIRQEQGSPLAGTVLADGTLPHEENQLFLTALEQVAQASPAESTAVCTAESCPADLYLAAAPVPDDDSSQLVAHLYQMAQIDEDGGRFERADKWRKLARELRNDGTTGVESDEQKAAQAAK